MSDHKMQATLSMDAKKFIEGAANSKKELRALVKEISNATVAYRGMSDAEKNSAFGKEIARQIQEMTQRAGELQDAIGDVRQNITNLASDTAQWDAMKQGIQGAASAMQAYVSIISAVGGENERLTDLVKKLAVIQTTANAAITIGNALQKQSALMIGLRTAAEKLDTLFTQKNTTAIKENTTATNAETAAVDNLTHQKTLAERATSTLTSKYTKLGIVMGAVGSAVFTLMDNMEKLRIATEKERAAFEAQNKMAQEAADAHGRYAAEVAVAAHKIDTAFNSLKDSFMQVLKQGGNLNEWAKKHAEGLREINAQGLTTNQLTKIFVSDSTNYVRALKARTQAQIAQNYAMEAYVKYMNAMNHQTLNGAEKMTKSDWQKYFKENFNIGISDKDFEKYFKEAQHTGGGTYIGSQLYQISTEGMLKYNKAIQQGSESVQALAKNWENAKAEADKAIQSAEALTSHLIVPENEEKEKPITTTQPKVDINPIDKYNNGLALQQQLYEQNAINEEEYYSNLKKITDEYADSITANAKNGKLTEEQVELVKKLKEQSEGYAAALEKIKEAKKAAKDEILKDIDKPQEMLKLNFEVVNPEDKQKVFEAATKKIQELGEQQKVATAEQSEEIKKQIELYHQLIETITGIPYYNPLENINDPTKMAQMDFSAMNINDRIQVYDAVSQKIQELQAQLSVANEEEIAGIQQKIQAYQQLQAVIGANGKKMEDNKKSQEGINKAVAAFGNLAGSVGQISEDQDVQTAALVAQAIATLIAQFASVPKGATVWDWVAGSAMGMATLIAMIAQIKSLGTFADGGIFRSGSSIGDRGLARLNNGEMVLNNRQQGNLFRILEEGGFGHMTSSETLNINMTARGSDLYASLKNYERRMNKI